LQSIEKNYYSSTSLQARLMIKGRGEARYKETAVDYDSHAANFLICLNGIIERQCDPASPDDKNNNIRRYLALRLQLL
jgi:hypothetical protein